LIPSYTGFHGHIPHVKKVVGYAPSAGFGHFCRPDIHSPVQLHSIGVHDFDQMTAFDESGGKVKR
jgi:hypothetical protein